MTIFVASIASRHGGGCESCLTISRPSPTQRLGALYNQSTHSILYIGTFTALEQLVPALLRPLTHANNPRSLTTMILRNMHSSIILALLVAALFHLQPSSASADDNSNNNNNNDNVCQAHSNSSLQPSDWISTCHKQGFDPWTLHCQTCSLLQPLQQASADTTIVSTCLACCQSYKDVDRITKPYEAAVLAVSDHDRNTEMDDFLRDDWENLVKTKGETRLARIAKGQEASRHFFYFTVSPSVLFFLDDKLGKNAQRKETFASVKERAKETIYLDGWKRDDIRDMLAALLP
jgi:hypothetical protein